MKDPIKFTQEELNELNQIQMEYQEKTLIFGQMYLDRLVLDEKYKQLADAESNYRKEYEQVQKKEEEWLTKITTKYGEGRLNIASGTFIPN